MKILVLGASGFMGRNILTHLRYKGYDVYGTVFNHDPFDAEDDYIYKCDLLSEPDLRMLFSEIVPDIVIQAAATTSGSKDIVTKPYIHVTDNAVMNSLILRKCFEFKVKHFLFLSCCVMYQPGNVARKETDFNLNDPILPNYFGVGWTKVYIEQMCKFYSTWFKTTAIRHTNTYGPHDKYDLEHSHVFGATIRKVMDATDKISIWGTGEEARDLLYVSDVSRAVDILIDKQTDPFELVNVSYGAPTTINDLVKLIVDASGKILYIEHDLSAPTIPVTLSIDHSYITNKYGWEPNVSIAEGVSNTLSWYKEHYKGH